MIAHQYRPIDDGGPAFPHPGSYDAAAERQEIWPAPGMSLWHYYAGQALAGLLFHVSDPPRAAKYSAEYADAMIAEARKRMPK